VCRYSDELAVICRDEAFRIDPQNDIAKQALQYCKLTSDVDVTLAQQIQVCLQNLFVYIRVGVWVGVGGWVGGWVGERCRALHCDTGRVGGSEKPESNAFLILWTYR